DATGRASTCRFGFPRRTVFDRLVAAARHAPAEQDRGMSDHTLVGAVDSGRVYSALLPSGGFMLVFFKDADLYSAGRASSLSFLSDQLGKAPLTLERIASIPASMAVCPALTSIRESVVVRSNWVATGDAARSYDPLCGLGLTSAMNTAIRAAQT